MTIRDKTRSIWRSWSDLSYFVHTRLVVAALWLVGVYLLAPVLGSLGQDSTRLTSSFFAAAATLAALSFSAARAIPGPEEAKDTFAYSGERFFHSALLFVVASAVKYAYQSAAAWFEATLRSPIPQLIAVVTGIVLGTLFLFALHAIHGGLLFASQLLWKRMARRRDWDRLD